VPGSFAEKPKDNLTKFSYDAAKNILAILVMWLIARLEVFEPRLFIGAVIVGMF